MHESSFALEFANEGEQNGVRQSVLQALALRFGEEQSKEFAKALERITDLNRLLELHKQAIQARRLSQFRRSITAS